MLQKRFPKSHHNGLTWFQNDSQNEPDGSKMESKWSRWAQNGQERALRRGKGAKERKRKPKEASRREKLTPLGGKKRSKSIKKRVWKHACLKVALWIDVGVLFASKIVPQRDKIEPKIDQKFVSWRKSEFSLPYSKNQWILMISKVQGLIFWS